MNYLEEIKKINLDKVKDADLKSALIELSQFGDDDPEEIKAEAKDFYEMTKEAYPEAMPGYVAPKPTQKKRPTRKKPATPRKKKPEQQPKAPKKPNYNLVKEGEKRQKVTDNLELVMISKNVYELVHQEVPEFEFEKRNGYWNVQCKDAKRKAFKTLKGAVSHVAKTIYSDEYKAYVKAKAEQAKRSKEWKEKHPTGQTTPTQDVEKSVDKAVDKLKEAKKEGKSTDKQQQGIVNQITELFRELDKKYLKEIYEAIGKMLKGEKFANGGEVGVTSSYRVTEVFSNGDSNNLGEFKTKKEAMSFFKEKLKQDGYKPNDMESWELELNKLTLDEDGDLEDIETIESQTLYEEGTMDRNNYKGDSVINYGYEALWNADKQELEYTFYFQGEKKEGTVLESELDGWYYS